MPAMISIVRLRMSGRSIIWHASRRERAAPLETGTNKFISVSIFLSNFVRDKK